MSSPFPGMDPYIEHIGVWEDFHLDLISEIKHAVSSRLPPRYVIRAGERSYIVVSTTNGLVETEFREGFLEIREVHGERKLITGIEVLSPSNKRPGTPGWEQYSRKRQAFLEGAANFVEIDLLRGGSRMPMETPWPGSPYYLLASRKREAPRCTVWPTFSLRPLPPLPIPLAPPDADIELPLQPLIDAIYGRSQYEHDIDYHRLLTPPLSAAEASWLEAQLREQQTKV